MTWNIICFFLRNSKGDEMFEEIALNE